MIGGSGYTENMSKGILVAGNDSALLSAVETEVAKRVERYALAVIPNRFAALRDKPSDIAVVFNSSLEKARIPLGWNPGSPASARAMLLAAENDLEHIDEAILVCSPPLVPCAVADLKPLDIEILVSDHVKSWLFLVKELTAGFKMRERGGALFLVYPEAGGAKDAPPADILGSAAVASFRSLTQKLLATVSDEEYTAQGFTGGEAGDETAFADFIFRQLDDAKRKANGKLHKYKRPDFSK